MRRVRLALAAVVAVAVVSPMLAPPRPAFACSCAATPVPGDISTSDVVFSGIVLSLGPGFQGGSSAAPREVTFAVDHSWLGEVPAQAIVLTASSGASCGYERFVEGQRFLVYARDRGTAFETNLCQPTSPYDDAAVAALREVAGPGVEVVPAQREQPAVTADGGNTRRWWWAAGGAALVAAVVLGVGVWRFRRHR